MIQTCSIARCGQRFGGVMRCKFCTCTRGLFTALERKLLITNDVFALPVHGKATLIIPR